MKHNWKTKLQFKITNLDDIDALTHIDMFSKPINEYLCGNLCFTQYKETFIISQEIEIDKTTLISEKLFILDKNTDKFVMDDSFTRFKINNNQLLLFDMLNKLDNLLYQKINVEHDSKFTNGKKLVYNKLDISNSITIPIKFQTDNKCIWFHNNYELIRGNIEELKLQLSSTATINFAIQIIFCTNTHTQKCWLSLKIHSMLLEK